MSVPRFRLACASRPGPWASESSGGRRSGPRADSATGETALCPRVGSGCRCASRIGEARYYGLPYLSSGRRSGKGLKAQKPFPRVGKGR